MHKAKANFSPETTHVPVNLKPKSPGLRGGGGGVESGRAVSVVALPDMYKSSHAVFGLCFYQAN